MKKKLATPWTRSGLVAGDKTKRFMMVGTKDALPAGAKTGVVAPVPINTPSLRQEIHGSQGDNTGIASINRSSSAGGWGSATGVSSASEGKPADQGNSGGKGKGRGNGGSRQGGDDVFTRHFPDLRAGLEQAEKLDAVTKASSKVAPLRKPKPEPAKGQGPSLRPRGTQESSFLEARCRMIELFDFFVKESRRDIVSDIDIVDVIVNVGCNYCVAAPTCLRETLQIFFSCWFNDTYVFLQICADISRLSVLVRPAMLKPTGSAGGGSAATAAAQAAIADAVHNRVATAPKPEERRKPVASFADEISSKSRWTERPPQEGGARARGGRGGDGRGAGGSAWESNKEGGRGVGKGGREFDRGGRGGDAFQDKDRRSFRQNPDRSSMNNTRGKESIFGSGGHVGIANSSQDSTINGGTKTPTTTYVRQHGPPPRKITAPTSTPAPTPQHDHPSASQQPTRSSAYSASTRSNDQSRGDPWDKSTETSSKWRPAQQAMDAPPEVSPTLDSPSSQSGAYVRAHGPPRRSGREAQVDEHGAASTSFSRQDRDVGGEATSRFGGSWGASEQGRGVIDKDSSGGVERTLSGRWKEPTDSLAPPPPPTNTRWKEPKEEPRAGGRRWKVREEGQMGSGRWGRSVEEDGDVDGGNVAASSLAPSPPQNNSWKESATDGWGLEVAKHGRLDGDMSATPSTSKNSEQQQQQRADDGGVAIGTGGAASCEQPAEVSDDKEPAGTTAEGISPEDATSFRGSFTQQQQAQPVIPNASWEPQLPRGAGGGGDLWETPGHGHDNRPQQQRSGQAGPSTSGGASQPWGDPWGTSGFGLPASGDQGSGSMASFLENDEPRKERYLPPALRNRTPSQGNQEDSANGPSVEEKTDTNPPSLPDVASTDLSAQDLVLPGGGGIGAASPDRTGAAKAPLYEQQEQQQQQQAPLEDWQQGGAQPPHRSQQDQVGHPVEPTLHQQQPIHQCHQVGNGALRFTIPSGTVDEKS